MQVIKAGWDLLQGRWWKTYCRMRHLLENKGHHQIIFSHLDFLRECSDQRPIIWCDFCNFNCSCPARWCGDASVMQHQHPASHASKLTSDLVDPKQAVPRDGTGCRDEIPWSSLVTVSIFDKILKSTNKRDNVLKFLSKIEILTRPETRSRSVETRSWYTSRPKSRPSKILKVPSQRTAWSKARRLILR